MKLSDELNRINSAKTIKPRSNSCDFSCADVNDLFSWLEIRKLQINATNSLLETSQLSNRADVFGVYQ